MAGSVGARVVRGTGEVGVILHPEGRAWGGAGIREVVRDSYTRTWVLSVTARVSFLLLVHA